MGRSYQENLFRIERALLSTSTHLVPLPEKFACNWSFVYGLVKFVLGFKLSFLLVQGRDWVG